ncbi:MAG: thioredoxin reductase [Dehalococcoidia bacterium]|nr:thioredoxin reductase [Dehalococcoidia bacterium]|tara:strand:- start:913 stop:1833 length:921 start_codon:yes stop_codon:yes gene_type:complete
METDLLIAGQGAAGYSAALYSARYQVNTIIAGGEFGGETAIGGMIENYPGIEADGFDLMMNMKNQVMNYDIKLIEEDVKSIEKYNSIFIVNTETSIVESKGIILCVGRERRKLGLPNEEELVGKGVSYCSTCDAPLYKNKIAAIVGGGNAAVEGAILLSKYAKEVHLIYRGANFHRPEKILISQLEACSNINIHFNSKVEAILTDNAGVSGINLTTNTQESKIMIDGIFIEIGADPRLELPYQLKLKIDNSTNEVDVNKLMETSVEGVFAAGDLTNASGSLKQTVTAAGQGAIAALSAYTFLNTHK